MADHVRWHADRLTDKLAESTIGREAFAIEYAARARAGPDVADRNRYAAGYVQGGPCGRNPRALGVARLHSLRAGAAGIWRLASVTPGQALVAMDSFRRGCSSCRKCWLPIDEPGKCRFAITLVERPMGPYERPRNCEAVWSWLASPWPSSP